MTRHAALPRSKCPVCAQRHTRLMLECTGAPVFCNVLYPTRAQALQVGRGDLELRFCPGCGMIFNAAFDPGRLTYSETYENAQHFSPRFSQYLEELAASLIHTHRLEDRDIIEFGCGDGRFLGLLCAGSRNRGFGFDSALKGPQDAPAGVTLFPHYYTAQAQVTADFVCCRHVLEHVLNPHDLLASARRALGKGPGGVAYFEVPNAMFTLRDLGIWDLLYEHCSYFTPSSLARLFETCGFDVLDARARFDDQFLSVEATPAAQVAGARRVPSRDERHTECACYSELVTSFAERYRSKVLEWNGRLSRWSQEGRRVAIWGAGTKGVMFLNSVAGGEKVDCVVDINPRKTGCHVAGTGQRIIAPGELRTARPDVLLIMNPAYEGEIRATLQQVGCSPQVVPV